MYEFMYLSLSPLLRVSGRVAFKMAPVMISEGVEANESPATSSKEGRTSGTADSGHFFLTVIPLLTPHVY